MSTTAYVQNIPRLAIDYFQSARGDFWSGDGDHCLYSLKQSNNKTAAAILIVQDSRGCFNYGGDGS
ncbi:hypothetical protein FC91_GL003003 [Schleiferilactobacillus harbinensis DSM 16991]|uniref:Uncharacterized protein n=2 Tax=Schleiferilactobacillus harbinensis TaxID=304207 RepID=A0A0R1X8K3_9LACO|nr:hypothetical protein FC91_GL003003 [Schleiferilactobacillus harbinensis DSM 16991]